MSTAATPLPAPARHRLRTSRARLWSGILALWAAVTGSAPHVLHHVGPLAGAALVAGASGKLLFAAIGFIAAVPFLVRLKRRFASWKAPAIALAVFIGMFSLSTFVIGPAITGASDTPNLEQPGGHLGHHPK